MKINYIKPLSLAKFQAIFGFFSGIIAGVIYSTPLFQSSTSSIAMIFLTMFVVVLAYSLVGFISGIIIGVGYNFFASKIGGIEIEFDNNSKKK